MPDPTDPARAVAARLGQTAWQLDAEPDSLTADPDSAVNSPDPPPGPARLFPRSVGPAAAPPPAERIVEALLFAGGPPLTASAAAGVVRGLTPDRFLAAVDGLNRQYRAQRRPYTVAPRADGFVMVLRPAFVGVTAAIYAGPREARLTQPALDVLSLVAYKQPVEKAAIDAGRGADSAGPLRQLVRLGLIVLTRTTAAGLPPGYRTTPRFLEVMNLTSLDDLPRLGEPRPAG